MSENISETYILFQSYIRLIYNARECSTLTSRSSSANEIANVNFFNDDIIHALQNTIDSGIHSATGRRYSSQPEAKH